MVSRRRVALSVALAALPLGAARAQDFPNRPVRLIVPLSPGGPGDSLCRRLLEPMQRNLSQPVIVENRLGAAGSVGANYVRGAAPDGHTLLQVGNATVTTALLEHAAGYDPLADFAPVALLATRPMLLLFEPGVAAGGVAELLERARARPGDVRVASAERGSLGHLAAESLNQHAGLTLTITPKTGAAQALKAVLAGAATAALVAPSQATDAAIAASRLRVLAVSSPRRNALWPGVPAIAETIPPYSVSLWFGLVAPARTPPDVVARLNDAVNGAVGEPAVQTRLKALGMASDAGTPTALADVLRAERVRWADVIQRAGLPSQ